MNAQLHSTAPADVSHTRRSDTIRVVAGFIVIYAVFEGLARLLPGLGIGRPLSFFAIALPVIATAFAAEMLLFRCTLAQAGQRLGLGRPAARAVGVALLMGGLMVACYPLISRVTGTQFSLPADALWMFLGVFAMNGIAEEMMMRGYLFRHLRATRTFRRAVLQVMLLHALMHIPIILEAGPVVGAFAMLTALATGIPMAYLFERGGNTIWAPALLHFSANTIIVLNANNDVSQPATQMATVMWLLVVIIMPYIVLAFRRRLLPRADAHASR